MFGFTTEPKMVAKSDALPGRNTPLPTAKEHHVFGRPLTLDVPQGHDVAVFAMGCYWGVERMFWQIAGVYMTMVGNAGGFTPNPTYEETCTGKTGHTEAVRVTYDPAKVSYDDLLRVFWEGHDPTQSMRQGNDRGTQYRSAIYTTTPAQLEAAKASAAAFAPRLQAAGYGAIVTEIAPLEAFYWAEAYHQQYLSKNPNGYCGIGGTGVRCSTGTGA